MTKRSDLFRRYADVIDMCEGAANVKPWECVKNTENNHTFIAHPAFSQGHEIYEFALAIVEDKPVFVGDVLYNNETGSKSTVSRSLNRHSLYIKEQSIPVLISSLTWINLDQSETIKIHGVFGGDNVKVKFTKNSITGKISAEMVDE